jgi:glucosamine-6-phosphate deaminase
MSGPRVVVVGDREELGVAGADLVAEAIRRAPEARVVAATGRSPMGVYARLAALGRSGSLDAARVVAVQLDEYLGLANGDRRSLLGWMRASFLEPLGIADDRLRRLPVDGELDHACLAFDDRLADEGGIDVAILGLGPNGHLGFNEPPSDADTPTRAVELTPETIRANARYWGSELDVPARAVTVGLRPLLAARTIVVVVSGAGKRAILHRALEGPVGADVPASFLREAEGDVTVVADRGAWGNG